MALGSQISLPDISLDKSQFIGDLRDVWPDQFPDLFHIYLQTNLISNVLVTTTQLAKFITMTNVTE